MGTVLQAAGGAGLQGTGCFPPPKSPTMPPTLLWDRPVGTSVACELFPCHPHIRSAGQALLSSPFTDKKAEVSHRQFVLGASRPPGLGGKDGQGGEPGDAPQASCEQRAQHPAWIAASSSSSPRERGLSPEVHTSPGNA